MSTYLIINEQHSLFDEQRDILREFGKVKFINIPSAGLTSAEMDSFEVDHRLDTGDTIIFASPIPYLLKLLASTIVSVPDMSVVQDLAYNVKVFHNDTRVKKELPNGKIVQTVSEKGWRIL